MLRGYFEPSAKEREEGKKIPTQGTRAIAELVVGKYVRLVLTTNFDRVSRRAGRRWSNTDTH